MFFCGDSFTFKSCKVFSFEIWEVSTHLPILFSEDEAPVTPKPQYEKHDLTTVALLPVLPKPIEEVKQDNLKVQPEQTMVGAAKPQNRAVLAAAAAANGNSGSRPSSRQRRLAPPPGSSRPNSRPTSRTGSRPTSRSD